MKHTFKKLPIAALVTFACVTQAQQVAYSPEMIRALVPSGQDIDMTFFERGYDIPPGAYRVTLQLNGELYREGMYELREFNGSLVPVFHVKEVRNWPLKDEVLKQFAKMNDDDELFPIGKYIQDVQTSVNTEMMGVDVSIPQLYLAHNDGWVDVVDPELWDYGETGAIVNYNLSASHSRGSQGNSEYSNLYLNFDGQLNLGAWRLHTSGSFSGFESKVENFKMKAREWDLWNTYFERDLPAIKGQLQIGEISTSSELFDSVPLRGVRVYTNAEMLPRRDRSYSPVIEGTAYSNAQIIIRQNGHIVYTLNVAPGPFRLDDLPSFGSYGDLEVVIRESDGTERLISVPYSSVPNMLKEGQHRYDFSVGRYYSKGLASNSGDTEVLMGTLSYGLPRDITVFGGALMAKGYYSLAFGTGLSLGRFGAVAADVVHSVNDDAPERAVVKNHGSAWRVRYEKTMSNLGTTVNLANYRYITGGYSSLSDYLQDGAYTYYMNALGQLHSRWQLALNQSLGNYGSLSIGADYAMYRSQAPDAKSFNLGYSTSIKGVGVSLSYGRNYQQVGSVNNRSWESSHIVSLNLNIPLDLIFGGYTTNSIVNNTDIQYMGRMFESARGEKDYSHSVVLNTTSEDYKWNYTLSQELGSHEDRATSLNVGYSGDRAYVNLGYDHNSMGDTYRAGMNGALVFHKTGITAAQNAYGAVAIVEVPDAPGVKVANGFSSTTDIFGHSVLTYLTHYSRNQIAIDPASVPSGAMLLDSSNRVVIPTKGAIVRASYPVRFGQQAVFILKTKEGTVLPFGSTVNMLTEDGKKDPFVSGMVGEGGRVYLTGIPKEGTLQVIQNEQSLNYEYELEEVSSQTNDGFVQVPTITLYAKNIQ